MYDTDDFTGALQAIRSASALTEVTFLKAGQALESSIEILTKLTSGSEALLDNLEGENLSHALKALSRTAAEVNELGRNQARESGRLDRLRGLTQSIGQRVSQMSGSLKYVDSLGVNAKIAAALINAPGVDFSSFADEIGRTLEGTKNTLDSFAAELLVLRRHVTAAHEGQLRFETFQHDAASSITERLLATVKSIALQHQRAARSGREVKLGSVRVRQRICDAILALQIGDITRQRLEHAESALDLVAETRGQRAAGQPGLDADEQRTFAVAIHLLLSAQLSDAADNFNRDIRQVTESLTSLAAEARRLRSLGNSAYGSSDRDGGDFITELEGQVGEALALFEGFETARADVSRVTASVSEATESLCGHLQNVQALETDIRIMGLNTTFKCARIGRDGAALSLIAHELRSFANGFAKEAGALMGEVENVASVTGSLLSGKAAEQAPLMAGGAQAMRDSHATLQQMRQILGIAVTDLERDSDRVVTLLTETVADLGARNKIGQVLGDAAENLTAPAPRGHLSLTNLAPRVEQKLELMARGYTMANERVVHDRVLGRSTIAAPVSAAAELEDFLF